MKIAINSAADLEQKQRVGPEDAIACCFLGYTVSQLNQEFIGHKNPVQVSILDYGDH